MSIPTKYQGIQYRSRLEAKWAAFFHRMGWEFEYEPFDGHGYIPDFVIQTANKGPILVEVKPAITEADYHAPVPKIVKGIDGLWTHLIFVLGVSPFPDLQALQPWMPTIGLAGLHNFWVGSRDRSWRWDPAIWGERLTEGRTMGELRQTWAEATNEVQWKGRQ